MAGKCSLFTEHTSHSCSTYVYNIRHNEIICISCGNAPKWKYSKAYDREVERWLEEWNQREWLRIGIVFLLLIAATGVGWRGAQELNVSQSAAWTPTYDAVQVLSSSQLHRLTLMNFDVQDR